MSNSKKEKNKKVFEKNIKLIKEKARQELDEGEFIEVRFIAQPTGLQFLSALLYSADYYVMPTLMRDVGMKYIVYGTTNKIMIYEVGELSKINREYIIDYKNIKKYDYKVKKDATVIHLKAEKDKYGELRETSNWLLYGYLQNRINMRINSPDQDKIVAYFNSRIS